MTVHSRRRFSYIIFIESAQDEEPMSALSSTAQKKALGRVIEDSDLILVSTHWDLALPDHEGEVEEREIAMHADGSFSKYLIDTGKGVKLRRSGRQEEGVPVVPGHIEPRDLIFDLVGIGSTRPEQNVTVQVSKFDSSVCIS